MLLLIMRLGFKLNQCSLCQSNVLHVLWVSFSSSIDLVLFCILLFFVVVVVTETDCIRSWLDGNPFDIEDEQFATILADFCGIAINNAQLYDTVRSCHRISLASSLTLVCQAVHQRERADTVMSFAQSLQSNLDVDTVLRSVFLLLFLSLSLSLMQ